MEGNFEFLNFTLRKISQKMFKFSFHNLKIGLKTYLCAHLIDKTWSKCEQVIKNAFWDTEQKNSPSFRLFWLNLMENSGFFDQKPKFRQKNQNFGSNSTKKAKTGRIFSVLCFQKHSLSVTRILTNFHRFQDRF